MVWRGFSLNLIWIWCEFDVNFYWILIESLLNPHWIHIKFPTNTISSIDQKDPSLLWHTCSRATPPNEGDPKWNRCLSSELRCDHSEQHLFKYERSHNHLYFFIPSQWTIVNTLDKEDILLDNLRGDQLLQSTMKIQSEYIGRALLEVGRNNSYSM